MTTRAAHTLDHVSSTASIGARHRMTIDTGLSAAGRSQDNRSGNCRPVHKGCPRYQRRMLENTALQRATPDAPVGSHVMFLRILTLLMATIFSSCGPAGAPDPADPFTATGQLVALSGGEAGANNACHTCHGLMGEGDGAGTPRLSGLPYGYLMKQLQDYADGRRQHPAMQRIASRLGDADRQLVALWYSGQPVPAVTDAPQTTSLHAQRIWTAGDPERELRACAECHGALGEGVGRGNPPLHDQPAAYLTQQLQKWRRGERQNSPLGVMLEISRRLTDEEMIALSEYAAQLPGRISPAAQGEAPSPPERRPDR